MRRANRSATMLLSLLLGGAAGAPAQDDPCASTLNYGDYLTELTAQISNEINGNAATAAAADETAQQLSSRANADGLTGNRLDLLHRAFVALGLGQVDEEEGQLVFNFNPDFLDFDFGQLSPRVIVHDPVLFKALDERIGALPEDIRQTTRNALQEEVGDLSDVEARVRWTNASSTPDALIQELASGIFQPAYDSAAQAELQAISQQELSFRRLIAGDLSISDRQLQATSVSSICAMPSARAHFLQLVSDLRTRGRDALTTLGDALTEAHFFDLADLIDGEPRLSFEAAYRMRDDAAGPDDRSASLRYEFGNISYRDFKRWADRQGRARDAASVQEYLESQKARRALPKLSVSLDYSSSPELRIPLAAGTPDFVQPDVSKITGAVRGGWYFGGARDRRFELEANYDDVSDDPARQDRFVGKLSWVEKLSGLAQAVAGSDLVVTLVYASKPEFRGEVDEELGMRFGLKWSLGDPTQ